MGARTIFHGGCHGGICLWFRIHRWRDHLVVHDVRVLRDGSDRVGVDLVDRATGWVGVAVLDFGAAGDRGVDVDCGDDRWGCALFE